MKDMVGSFFSCEGLLQEPTQKTGRDFCNVGWFLRDRGLLHFAVAFLHVSLSLRTSWCLPQSPAPPLLCSSFWSPAQANIEWLQRASFHDAAQLLRCFQMYVAPLLQDRLAGLCEITCASTISTNESPLASTMYIHDRRRAPPR